MYPETQAVSRKPVKRMYPETQAVSRKPGFSPRKRRDTKGDEGVRRDTKGYEGIRRGTKGYEGIRRIPFYNEIKERVFVSFRDVV